MLQGRAAMVANEAEVKSQNETGRSETHLGTLLLGWAFAGRWLRRFLLGCCCGIEPLVVVCLSVHVRL
jgi:hypothetical protein